MNTFYPNAFWLQIYVRNVFLAWSYVLHIHIRHDRSPNMARSTDPFPSQWRRLKYPDGWKKKNRFCRQIGLKSGCCSCHKSYIFKAAVYIRRKEHTASARMCVGWFLMLIRQCVELPWRLTPLLFGVAGNVWGFGDTVRLFTLISLTFNWSISLTFASLYPHGEIANISVIRLKQGCVQPFSPNGHNRYCGRIYIHVCMYTHTHTQTHTHVVGQ
jgi:hypothetical protein